MAAAFVDRLSDLRAITDLIAHNMGSSIAVIVHAPSGVGKTALTRQVANALSARKPVRISVPASSYPEGAFIERIAEALDESGNMPGSSMPTLRTFVSQLPTQHARDAYHQRLADELRGTSWAQTLGLGTVATMLQRASGRGPFDPWRMLRDTVGNGTLFLLDYISVALAQGSPLILLENIQSIDTTSLRLLRDLLNAEGTIIHIIAEYTSGLHEQHALHSIAEHLRTPTTDVHTYELHPLPHDAVQQLIPHPHLAPTALRLYAEHHGNLRQIEDLALLSPPLAVSLGLPGVSLDASAAHLRALSPASQFLITALAVHRSRCRLDALMAFYEHCSHLRDIILDVRLVVPELERQHLILRADQYVEIAHDSLARTLVDTPEFMRFTIIAAAAWRDYYGDLHIRQDYNLHSKSDVLMALFNANVLLDPLQAVPLLNELRELALASLAPDTAISLLRALARALDGRSMMPKATRGHVSLALLEIYYCFGLFEEAWELLSSSSLDPQIALLYEVALLDRLDRHNEALVKIDALLEDRQQLHPRLLLCLRLLEMVCLRSTNRDSEAEVVFRDLGETAVLERYPEWGYYLRNAEIVVSARESLEYLNRSIRHFGGRPGYESAMAHSRISLGMQLTRLGELARAEEEYSEAAVVLQHTTLERHLLLNNSAAIALMSQTPDGEAATRLLTSALRTALTSFDRLAIYSNLLAASDFQQQVAKGDQIVAILDALCPLQPDRVMVGVVKYNISRYYERHGAYDLAASYLRDAIERDDGTWPYWKHRLYGLPLDDADDEFCASHPYHYSLLSYWHFPIPRTFDG